ncbi:MAG: CRISPR-associated endoribonuclease Cas6 [Thermomicrobium sp.]|nr:CRISPR-associated endoribonuclease Cas6 [Thermomicrobium sp.]
MPIALVFELWPERDALLPPFLGRATHALLLRRIGAVDPELATRLHEPNETRPFTVSVLEEGIRLGRRETRVLVGTPLHVRLTVLEDELEPTFRRAFAPGSKVEIESLALRVGTAREDARADGVLQRISYAQLIEDFLYAGRDLPHRLTLRFVSPTTFHQRDRHLPLPLPQLVFGGAAERWNAYAPVYIAPEIVRGFERIRIGAYALRTRLVETGQGKVIGFLGWCDFRLEAVDRPVSAAAWMLATFANYSGIGQKTAMGLGHVVLRQPLLGRPG